MASEISKFRRNGRAGYILIPKHIADRMRFQHGDAVAIREAGDKLVIERIPMESFARVKAAPAELTR